DAGPGGNDGKFGGDPQIVEETLPGSIKELAGSPASAANTLAAFPTLAADKMLHLDGGSRVELPPNLLSGLDTITIEGWVKWQAFNPYSRFFSFGEGDADSQTRLAVMNVGASNMLSLVVDDFVGTQWRGWALYAPDPLPFNEWVHIAAV